jgi:site-specific DNA-methyltransferase (adenine-specific)
MDGLKQDWGFAKSIFINPPFKTVDKWVQKASESVASNSGQVIVMLIAARTDTQRFHRYIYNKPNVKTRFLKGRIKFEGTKNSAPFPSMVVIFR